MDHTTYLERWVWVGLTLVVFLFLSPSAVLVGLVLWLWLHWKPRGWWHWVVSGVLLLGSWAGLVLLWDALAAQLIALREAIIGYTGLGTLLTRALPVWGEGTLLGPTIAGLVQLFRPQKPGQPAPAHQPAQPALPEQPTQTQLRGVQRRLTLPSPAVKPEPSPPPDAPSERSA